MVSISTGMLECSSGAVLADCPVVIKRQFGLKGREQTQVLLYFWVTKCRMK